VTFALGIQKLNGEEDRRARIQVVVGERNETLPVSQLTIFLNLPRFLHQVLAAFALAVGGGHGQR
jgi:hypothetical protein